MITISSRIWSIWTHNIIFFETFFVSYWEISQMILMLYQRRLSLHWIFFFGCWELFGCFNPAVHHYKQKPTQKRPENDPFCTMRKYRAIVWLRLLDSDQVLWFGIDRHLYWILLIIDYCSNQLKKQFAHDNFVIVFCFWIEGSTRKYILTMRPIIHQKSLWL